MFSWKVIAAFNAFIPPNCFVVFFLSRCTRLKCTTARQENKRTNSVRVTTGSISFHSQQNKKGKNIHGTFKQLFQYFKCEATFSHFRAAEVSYFL